MLGISELKTQLDRAIPAAYERFAQEAQHVDTTYADLIAEMADFIARGGKRLRPYVAYVCYVGSGGKEVKKFIDAAVSLEIFHNFLLIHDDILDGDTERYGGPNISGVYASGLSNRRLGDAAALIAGDAASAMARSIVTGADFPVSQRLKLLRLFDETLFKVIGGEFVDVLAAPLTGSPLDSGRIVSMYAHKTSCYSFELPIRFGMLLAGSDRVEAARAFSLPLGIAYQMQDDYLGLFGDEKITGKPVTSDLREGKQTYLYALARAHANSDQLRVLDGEYGEPDADMRAVEAVRAMCVETGACAELEETIARYVTQAQEALPGLGLSPEAEKAAEELIEALIGRKL